jgi:hypothetical protein
MRCISRLASLAFANPGKNPPSQALRCPSVPEGPSGCYLGPTMVLPHLRELIELCGGWQPIVAQFSTK